MGPEGRQMEGGVAYPNLGDGPLWCHAERGSSMSRLLSRDPW